MQGEAAKIRRRIRADPPKDALRWIEQALNDSRVVAVAAMRGGSSAAMHRITIVDGHDRTDHVVLRRYLRADQLLESPSCALLEANALRHMAPSTVPTPNLLGVDATGEHAGAPAVLMSQLGGQPYWDAPNRPAWARDLAQLAATIHASPLPAPGTIRDYAPYPQESYEPPRWARDRRVWEQATAIFHAPGAIPGGHRFLHRDFHPGNLLWRRRRLSGVVDWESASIGPPDVDIGHCRMNFLYEAPELAQLLADAWHDVTGSTYHPWADIVAIVGVLDGLRDRPPSPAGRVAIEETLARAVSELGAR